MTGQMETMDVSGEANMCSHVRLRKMSAESGLVQGCLWREGG